MEEPEEQIHSFVIRFWLEDTDEALGQVIWRGHITHVASGERRYIKEPDSITDFITPYLEGWGKKFGIGWRMRRWLLTKLLH